MKIILFTCHSSVQHHSLRFWTRKSMGIFNNKFTLDSCFVFWLLSTINLLMKYLLIVELTWMYRNTQIIPTGNSNNRKIGPKDTWITGQNVIRFYILALLTTGKTFSDLRLFLHIFTTSLRSFSLFLVRAALTIKWIKMSNLWYDNLPEPGHPPGLQQILLKTFSQWCERQPAIHKGSYSLNTSRPMRLTCYIPIFRSRNNRPCIAAYTSAGCGCVFITRGEE